MRRIGLISDIHGNTTALKAVLSTLRNSEVESIICLGDLVGKGPLPAEAIELCRTNCAIVIKGNWDDMIVNKRDTDQELSWHHDRLSREQIDYLGRLPEKHDFVFGGKNVRLFHSSSTGIHYRVHMHDSLENHNRMFENTAFTGDANTPDVVGYGDIHGAYIQCFRDKILFNVGSVGNPLDINQASFVVMKENVWPDGRATLDFSFRRAVYDIEKELKIAKSTDMPKFNEYKKELMTAVYRNRKE